MADAASPSPALQPQVTLEKKKLAFPVEATAKKDAPALRRSDALFASLRRAGCCDGHHPGVHVRRGHFSQNIAADVNTKIFAT
jgi:hypothetical protein